MDVAQANILFLRRDGDAGTRGGCYAGISHSWHSCLGRGWERCKTARWQGAGTRGCTECPLKAGALASLGTSSSVSPWCEHRRWGCYTVVVFPPGQSEVLGVSLLQVLGLSLFAACRGFVAFSMRPTRRSPMGRWKEGRRRRPGSGHQLHACAAGRGRDREGRGQCLWSHAEARL